MPPSLKFLLVFTLSCLALQNALAAECGARSGKTTVPLLELYTSEGCSSCPPADKWLSELPHDPSKFTALAFHVDYWNYIGWKDRFSKEEFTARQRKVAAFNRSSFVYTPQFVLNGQDFRHWGHAQFNNITAQQTSAPRANLSLNLSSLPDGSTMLSALAQTLNTNDARNSEVFIAVYENRLASKINAGENSGRELHHDYVVREFWGPYQINSRNEFSKDIPLAAEWKKRDAGVAAFVQNTQSGEILQSLQLPLCNQTTH